MGKKDRWNSSSDEDDNNNHKNKNKFSKSTTKKLKSNNNNNNNTNIQIPNNDSFIDQEILNNDDTNDNNNTTSTTSITSSLSLPLHNPLLQGCRSVYDTYERINHINEGSYGIVWKARDINTNEIVALKQIKFDVFTNDNNNATEGFPLTALREINILLELSHINIINVKEMVIGNNINQVYMVMEYYICDLKDFIKKYNTDNSNNNANNNTGTSTILLQSILKNILQQILLGIEYIHNNWYIHRDIKPSNILVHNNGTIVLTDFGLSRKYQIPQLYNMTLCVVTLWYRCPELLFGETKYNNKIDIWSIGCIFAELINKDTLFNSKNELEQIQQIFILIGIPNNITYPNFNKLPNSNLFQWNINNNNNNNNNDAVTPTFNKLFPITSTTISSKQTYLDYNGYNLLKQLLNLDPIQRISATNALQHKYFIEGVQPKKIYI